jgi:colanic acid/amylovoran biosynthesis glycosyltransferase
VADESLWRRALRRGCSPDRRRAVIAPAANTAYFDPGEGTPAEATARLRILSVGPLVWAQGCEHALYAAHLLLDRGVDFEYRIIGEGEHLPALTFARYQLGLEGRVELCAPRGPEALRSELRWADVFLTAAVAEGFTEAVAEAHAMQLPVVASERGLLDESMAGDGALVAPPRDPHALSETLEAVASDPALRRRLGERGRARAVEAFDLTGQLTRFDELYREAAA